MTDLFHTPRENGISVSDPAVANVPFSEIDTAIKALSQKIIVVSMALTAPPGSPTNGNVYIPLATATGDWAGLENQLVFSNDDGTSWIDVTPVKGLKVYINDILLPYEWNGTAWILSRRYIIAGSFNGIPADGLTVIRHEPVIPIRFVAGLTGTGSKFYGNDAATAETIFSLKKNGSEFGTLTIAVAGNEATIAVASDTDFVITDEFTIVNQATKDVTFGDIGFAIVAIKI